jgi:hypothetical protein
MLTIKEKQNFNINGLDYDTFKDVKGYKLLEDGGMDFVSINPNVYIYQSIFFHEF